MVKQDEQRVELRFWQHGAIFLFACAVLVSRRPDAVFHAQFWAEDGHVWFADAYNLGWWTAPFRTQDGYYQTLSRLAAALALLAPLYLAPLVLNVIAIAVQALPVNLLLFSRSSGWGGLRFRALLAGVYVALPNCTEMHAIVTSSQWLLALCVFLLLVASTPKDVAGRLFDVSILLLCGLSGPFCFFLLPVAIFLAWRRSDRWRTLEAGVLAALCFIQAWGLLVVNPSGRAHAALGASPALFARILGGHVFAATVLGGNGLAADPSRGVFVFLLCAVIGGIAIIAMCFAKSGIEMRLFILLSALLLAASLISPAAYPPPGVSRWELLAAASGIRYWFFPELTFAWSILWCLRSRTALLKIAAGYLLLMMCFGIVHDWRRPPLQDLHFAEYAKRFEAAPVGTVVTIPISPPGWNMRLVKHN
jgi:hypothetical protein